MKINTVLVTGASGKLGRFLLPALVQAGYRVRALQHRTPVGSAGVDVVHGDLKDSASARALLEDIDAVVHLATVKEDAEQFIDVSVRGTHCLLDEARRNKGVKQFLLAGGDAALGIYFFPNPYPLDENAPLRAYPGCYALSKVLEETLCVQFGIQYGLPYTILRASWIQAEDDLLRHSLIQGPGFGVPHWSKLAITPEQKDFFATKRPAVGCLLHPGGAPYKRHIVAAEDVVQAFLCALGNPAAVGETFNVAAPTAFSYAALSRHIATSLSLPVVDFVQDTYHDFSINVSKARNILGFHPRYDALAMADNAIAFRKTHA